MCNKVVSEDSYSLEDVLDQFVTQGQVKIWHEDFDSDDEIVEQYNYFKYCKVQKAEIKEELMHIPWHPTRMQTWCMTENEKKMIKEMFSQRR